MTNAAASIALTFDAVDIQDADLGIFLEITSGLNEGPEVRGVDVRIPTVAGQVARNRLGDSRRILLTGIVRGNGATHDLQQADYHNNWATLRALFDNTADPAPLVATLPNGDTATIDARTLNIAPNEVIQSLFAYVSIELVSVNPNWVISPAGS